MAPSCALAGPLAGAACDLVARSSVEGLRRGALVLALSDFVQVNFFTFGSYLWDRFLALFLPQSKIEFFCFLSIRH